MNEFTWLFCESGYALEGAADNSPHSGELLVQARRPVKGGRGWRRYAPLQSSTALFRMLADLDCDQKSILDFAHRFGLLTNPEVEPLRVWMAAIADMRSAVGSWDEVQIANPHPSLPFALALTEKVAAEALKEKAMPLLSNNAPAAERDN